MTIDPNGAEASSDRAATVAKWLVCLGALFLASVSAVLVLRTIPGLESLPLDVVFERPGFSIFLPLGTGIIASVILTGILWLIRRRKL